MADDLLGRPVITAGDLDEMTPEEVDEAWAASIVTDADTLPRPYVETIKRRAAQRLARHECQPHLDVGT